MKLTTTLFSTYLASALELKLGSEFKSAPQACYGSSMSAKTKMLLQDFAIYKNYAGPPFGVSDAVLGKTMDYGSANIAEVEAAR